MNTPPKSFYSINGCGTMLLDYLALPDGTYVPREMDKVLS